MDAVDLRPVVSRYLEWFPGDVASIQALTAQMDKGAVLNDRSISPGHATGAAIVLSPELDRVLLIHHGFLKKWLQPGGHWDPDEIDPLTAARREATEETGVDIARYLPLSADNPLVPIHLEVHSIPANDKKGEPRHDHYDFRYVFVAADSDLAHDANEVSQAGWFGFDAPEAAELRLVLDRVIRYVLPSVDRQTHES